MSLIRDARQTARQFADGEANLRAYSPGSAGIPLEDWWGALPWEYAPDEFGEYLTTSNPVFSCISQRAAYLAHLPLRLYRFTGRPALMDVPRLGDQHSDTLTRLLNTLYNGRPTANQQKVAIRGAIALLSETHDRQRKEMLARQMGMEEVVEGPAFELLHRVNPFWTLNKLIRISVMDFDLWGQAYWVVEREGELGLGQPKEIWRVKPTQMRPIPHPRRYISHYEYEPLDGSSPIPFRPWEVVRIFNPNPIDEFQPLSPLSSTSIFADHETSSIQSNMNLHEMGLHPGAIVMPTMGTVWSKQQARKVEEDINERFRGVKKAHRWGTFRHEVKIDRAGITPREAEFLGGMDYDVEAIARAYDWPIDLLAGKRTYENVEQAFKRAWQTVVLLGALFATDIAEFFLPMFNEGNVLVPHFDTTNIAVLQEAETARWEREKGQVDLVITRNEWRAGRGLPPLAGGDQLYIPANHIPLDLSGQQEDETEEVVGEPVSANGNGMAYAEKGTGYR